MSHGRVGASLADQIPVYPQRFAAHLWNNVRACRLRMQQVILHQCNVSLSKILLQEEPFWAGLQREAEASVLYLASEIAAAVPQLAGYLDQMIDKVNLAGKTYRNPTSLRNKPPHESNISLVHSREVLNNLMLKSDVLHVEQRPKEDAARTLDPEDVSTSYVEEQDGGSNKRLLTQKPVATECIRTASTYHMLSHLYNLRPIPSLPNAFKSWIRNRIEVLEHHTSSEDVARLQELVVKWPADGFPIDSEAER